MNPEERKMLERSLELAEENNRLIHKVRGVQKRHALWSIVKILIIVGIALGAFYYIEPYLEKVVAIFNQISGIKQSIDPSALQEILKNIKP